MWCCVIKQVTTSTPHTHTLWSFKTARTTSPTIKCHTSKLNPFYYQLMHITLKDAESLKHSKLDKNAPTCFGLHRNHLQGAKVSAWLKITRLVNSICVEDVQGVVNAMAAYCALCAQCTIHTPYRLQYAAIAQKTHYTSFTQILLTKRVIFSQTLALAPWRCFLCKPKHVGAFLSNL